jgi:choline dehydrogenase-like flavoprotein
MAHFGSLTNGVDAYDVVIVGAGVIGAVMAKVLVESALRERRVLSILILEAGPPTGLSADSYAAYLNQYYSSSLKTPNAPYSNVPNAPSPEDIASMKPPLARYFRQDGPLPFGSNNLRALGGTTLHWMGIALRMLPADFEMKTRYGRGEDWPLSYEDLRPFYEMAEWEIGVAATRAELEKTAATQAMFGNYEFPMRGIPTSYLDQWLSHHLGDFRFKIGERCYPVGLVPIPQARNSVPIASAGRDPRRYIDDKRRCGDLYAPYGFPDDPSTGRGQRCEGNASCIPICPVQAKYTALKTIRQLLDMSDRAGISVRLESRAVVTRLDTDDAGRISRIRYLQYESEELSSATPRAVSGRRVVLAASAIENAKVLLASRSNRFQDGVANKSGLVGTHLMDHPFVLTWGLAPEGQYLGTFRGPGATSDLPMRDGEFRRHQAAFRTDVSNWGWGLADDAPSQDLDRLIDPEAFKKLYNSKPQEALIRAPAQFGAALRSGLRGVVQRQMTLGFLLEQLPTLANRVSIDDHWRDSLGVHKPVIKYDICDYTRAGVASAADLASGVFDRVGATEFTHPDIALGTAIPYRDPLTNKYRTFKYIGAGHIMGTHRMGRCAKDSVVDRFQRSWEHDNLYIVGCGSMPTAGTSNPTLTAVAMCIQTAEEISHGLDLSHR